MNSSTGTNSKTRKSGPSSKTDFKRRINYAPGKSTIKTHSPNPKGTNLPKKRSSKSRITTKKNQSWRKSKGGGLRGMLKRPKNCTNLTKKTRASTKEYAWIPQIKEFKCEKAIAWGKKRVRKFLLFWDPRNLTTCPTWIKQVPCSILREKVGVRIKYTPHRTKVQDFST